MHTIFRKYTDVKPLQVGGDTVYIRPLPFIDFLQLHALPHGTEEHNYRFNCVLISAMIVDQDGEKMLLPTDVAKLDAGIFAQLLTACSDMAAVGQVEQKKTTSDPTPPSEDSTASA